MKKLRQEKDKEIKQLKNDIENLKNKPEKISIKKVKMLFWNM